MAEQSLKDKTIKGTIWNCINNMTCQSNMSHVK